MRGLLTGCAGRAWAGRAERVPAHLLRITLLTALELRAVLVTTGPLHCDSFHSPPEPLPWCPAGDTGFGAAAR